MVCTARLWDERGINFGDHEISQIRWGDGSPYVAALDWLTNKCGIRRLHISPIQLHRERHRRATKNNLRVPRQDLRGRRS